MSVHELRALASCLEPDLGVPTEVLHIFIAQQLENDVGNTSRKLPSGDILFVDDDTVGHRRSNKRQAIRDLRRVGVVIEGEVGQGVAQDREKQGQVAVDRSSAISCISIGKLLDETSK